MTEFMSHRVTEDYRGADVVFPLHFQHWLIEQVGVAPFALG